MRDNNPDYQLPLAIDQADEHINRFFDKTKSVNSKYRYKLQALLLNCSQQMKPLGMNLDNIVDSLKKEIDDDNFKTVQEHAKTVSDIIWENFEPTYIVSNYWSPTHTNIRRSVVFRRNSCEEQYSGASSYACAFYALTVYGRKKGLRSVVQYINDLNTTNRGLFSCLSKDCCANKTDNYEMFCDGCSIPMEARARWICFPPRVQAELLKHLGIETLIEDLQLSAMDQVQLQVSIEKLLEGGRDLPTGEKGRKDVSDYLERAARSLNEGYPLMPEYFKKYIEKATVHLKDFFHDEQLQPDGTINQEHACFMLATHLMWQRACCHDDTNFMYIFPTYVSDASDSCCVLTLGTEKPLTPIQELAAKKLASSLFINPLLLDYKEAEREKKGIEHFETHRRLLGHNFPKMLDIPALNQLQRIRNALDMYEKDKQDKPPLTQIQNRIDILESIFIHNESLLAATLSLKSPHHFFSKEPKKFPLRNIIGPLKGIAHLYREKANVVWQKSEISKSLILTTSGSGIEDKEILGHESFLRESIINLVINSFIQITKENIELDSDKGKIVVSMRLSEDKKWLNIKVEDKAGGFELNKLEAAEEMQKRLQLIDDEELFYADLSKLIFQKIKDSADGVHGLGILFCVAYLRAFEWAENILRPGLMKIKNTEEGSSVELQVPLVT